MTSRHIHAVQNIFNTATTANMVMIKNSGDYVTNLKD
jgi:hypothetical protein